MSNKSKKYELELENKQADEKETRKAEQEISFDTYFQMLMARKMGVMAHHKAPMRSFAESNGLGEKASLDEFEKIFKRY